MHLYSYNFVHSGYNFIHYGYNWLGAPLWLHFFLGSQWTWIDGTVNDGNVNFYPRRARCVSGSETTNHSSCNHARDDEMSDAKNCSERDPIRQTKRCRSSHETVASTSPGSVWPGKRDISAMSAIGLKWEQPVLCHLQCGLSPTEPPLAQCATRKCDLLRCLKGKNQITPDSNSCMWTERSHQRFLGSERHKEVRRRSRILVWKPPHRAAALGILCLWGSAQPFTAVEV